MLPFRATTENPKSALDFEIFCFFIAFNSSGQARLLVFTLETGSIWTSKIIKIVENLCKQSYNR